MLLKDLQNDKDIKHIIESVKNMNLSLLITDINGDIIFTNQAFSDLTEYSSEELKKQNPRIFKSNYHDDVFYKILWNTVLDGNTWRGEIFNKTKTGKLIWNTTAIFPIKNQNNEITYFVSIRENVNIQKNFNKFINIDYKSFDNGPVILFNCDTKDFSINYISKNIKKILGYEYNDFKDKKINFFSIVHPEDLERVKSEIEYDKNLIGLNFFSIDFRVTSKEGKIKYLSGKVNLLKNEKKEVINYHGYFLDITHQRELEKELCLSENKFEIAMDNVGYGVWDWNTKTNKVFYSKNWKTMLGFDELDQLDDVNIWKDSIHPLDKKIVLENTEKLLSKEIPVYEAEYRLKSKDGTYKWILSRGTVLDWEGNKATRVIGTHIDLTERKLKEEYKYKTKNIESLGRLAGNIAHNFNNILMSIQGNIELLKCNNDMHEDSIKEIETSISRAKKLSKKMLIFAKGGDPIKNKVNNLDKIIKKRVDSLLFPYKNKYKVLYDIEENLLSTNLDVELFTEAIDNIITNSIEAMPKEGIIRVNIKNTSKIENSVSENNKKYICISIIDSGVGIKENIMNKIFEPFFTTMPHKKEGVGLTAVNAIITKHDGEILVKSIENKGTEVKMYLVGYQDNKKEKSSLDKNLKPLKILIMEDEEIILNILQKFLVKSGYEVDTAINGENTIKKYIEHKT
jgi:PAS domain S-box-containing protein